MLRSSAAVSIAPEASNGVVTAGMIPSKSMAASCRLAASARHVPPAVVLAAGRVRPAPRPQFAHVARDPRATGAAAVAGSAVAFGERALELRDAARQRPDRVG